MRYSSIINRQSQIYTQLVEPYLPNCASPVKKISSEEQAKTNKESRKRIVEEMRNQQINYVAQLKLIEYRIKMPFQQARGQLGIDKPKIQYLFGDVIKFIQFHSKFINKLGLVIENPELHDSALPQIFDGFFQFLIIYGEYIAKIDKIVSQLQHICSLNSQLIRYLFMDFQQPLQHYMTLPASQVSNYSVHLNKYISSLQDNHPNFGQMCKYRDIYNYILTHRLNLSTVHDEEAYTSLMDSFKLQLNQQQLQLVFQEEVYVQQQLSMIYILQADKQTIINICKLQKISAQNKHKSMKVIKQTFLIPFADSIHYSNRIGICNLHQFILLRFKQHNRMRAFYQKCKILQGGAILKNYTEQYIFQAKIHDFSLAFCFSGTIFRRNIKRQPILYHVIKVFDYRIKLCQYVFITLPELEQILANICRNLKINILEEDFFIKNIMYSDQQLQQRKWMKLQNKLNIIVRNKQFRRHCQYLFHRFKIFQGFWKILTQQNYTCECDGCKIEMKQMKVPQLISILQSRRLENKLFCQKSWINARFQLQKKLIEKSKIVIQKNSQIKFQYQQKLYLCLLQFQKINRNMNKFYKKLKEKLIIKIKYYNIHGHKEEIQVNQQFQEQTIENLIAKISKKLQIQYSNDFCLYSINTNQIIQYEDHEYVSNIQNTFLDLHFGKKFYFSSKIEMGLITDKEQQNARVLLIVGEIVSRIQTSSICLQIDVLKDYLIYILEFYFHQGQIYHKDQINLNLLRKHLHMSFQNFINMELLQKVKAEFKQKGKTLKSIYFDLVNVFHRSGQSVSAFKALYLKTTIACSTVYQTIQAMCRFNFQGIRIIPIKTNKQIYLRHWEYNLSIIGTLLCFRLKNKAKQQSIWIKFDNSFFIWKKITIYKRMYEQSKQKSSLIIENQKKQKQSQMSQN